MLSVDTLSHLLEHYGYGIVFAVIGLEAMGVPFPGESMIITAAVYAATTGKLNIAGVIGACAAGAIMGDNIGYLIGRWAGFPLLKRYGSYVGLNERRMTLGQWLFQRHGGKVVFIGRFIAILRTFVALLAGASHMEWKSFLLWNAVGGIAWSVSYGIAAYLAGNAVKNLQGTIGFAIAAVAVVVAVGVVVVLRRNEKRLEDKAEQEMKRQPSA